VLVLLLAGAATTIAQNGQAIEKAIAAFEAAHPGVVKFGGDVKPAKLVRHVDPDFPQGQRSKLTPIMVIMVVSEFGEVVDPTVVISSQPEIDRRFLAAVRRWRYEPARKNGKPVRSFLTVTVTLEPALKLPTRARG
jgi:outer membrane biosynthesis protein TonB